VWELKIDNIILGCPSQFFSMEDKKLLVFLDNFKMEILRLEEETWRLRNRATWLKSGDKNTQFFHKFDKQRKFLISIWEINNSNGVKVTFQEDISKAALGLFKY
jgi:hypothetical protein